MCIPSCPSLVSYYLSFSLVNYWACLSSSSRCSSARASMEEAEQLLEQWVFLMFRLVVAIGCRVQVGLFG